MLFSASRFTLGATLRSTILALTIGLTTIACSASDLVDVGKPGDGIADDGTVKSYEGAVSLYYGAIHRIQFAVSTYTASTGLFTDEFSVTASSDIGIDTRSTGADSSTTINGNYDRLQKARGQAQQALGAFDLYRDRTPPAYVARLYAIQGIAEVLMAELLCSGFPLTDSPYGQDFKYTAGFTTSEVFTRAVAHFDSALAVTHDNEAVKTLARVGKGRALLNLGQYAAAATAVADVPTTSKYLAEYNNSGVLELWNQIGFYSDSYFYRVKSREGGNGLNWNTGDRRIPLDASGTIQTKYTTQTPIVVADGIEARLIEAEARLDADDIAGWAGILNTLRTSAITPAIPALSTDSTTTASDTLRVNVMFRERAFWLFLTGHRQGDLRRLLRQYGRIQVNVYPTGTYPNTNTMYPTYGSLVTIAPSPAEFRNPLYTGCFNRNP